MDEVLDRLSRAGFRVTLEPTRLLLEPIPHAPRITLRIEGEDHAEILRSLRAFATLLDAVTTTDTHR